MSGTTSDFTPLAEAFGIVLEGARVCRNLSLQAMAERAGMSFSDAYLLERGGREPELGMLFRLCAAVGVSPVWLLEEVITWAADEGTPSTRMSAPARDVRMRAIGQALTFALLGCSEMEFTETAVMGERSLGALAKHGLTVVALPNPAAAPSLTNERRDACGIAPAAAIARSL
jgi:transcriptional regulator with XRE-family HTH domain